MNSAKLATTQSRISGVTPGHTPIQNVSRITRSVFFNSPTTRVPELRYPPPVLGDSAR